LRLRAAVSVDVVEATGLARSLVDNECTEIPRIKEWSLLLLEDLLPEEDGEWAIVERERFRQLRLHALEALSVRLRRAGRIAEAVEAAQTAVSAEPLRESAQRCLIAAHLAEGNQAEALAAYDRFAILLDDELGLVPSRTTEEMLPAASVEGHYRAEAMPGDPLSRAAVGTGDSTGRLILAAEARRAARRREVPPSPRDGNPEAARRASPARALP
jgi:DNA-binding SARP family transcriptional activator